MLRPAGVLKEVFQFMLGADSIEGALVEQRIDNVCAEEFKNTNIDSLDLNENLRMFTPNQLEFIKVELQEFLYFFNYVDHPLDSDPNTVFLRYDREVQHD